MDHRLADVGYQCWRTILPEETLAMKLGFVIPIVGPAVSGAPGLSAFCRALEDLGYDTLWVGDRLVTPVDVDSSYLAHGPQMTRSLDPVLLWTVAAAATSRMRLNASTLSTFYYEPPHLARLLTTLDVLSDGRLGVGVGLGWMKQEYDIARNADWHRRGKMLDDMLAFLHAWWTTNPVSWDSEFFTLPPVHADLRPVQAGGPPIWIGGASEAAMRRVGRSGVGWLGFDGPAPAAASINGRDESADRLWSIARRAAQDAGRDPDALKTAMRINLEPGTSVGSLADKLQRYAESGVDEAFFDAFAVFTSLDQMLDFASQVIARTGRL
jgi:probable F420-dependent oxidoreductase